MYRIDAMTLPDVPEVSRVEARCFTNPWPLTAYRRELRMPDQNYYVVLRDLVDDRPAAGDDESTAGPAMAGVPAGLRARLPLPFLPFGRRSEPTDRIAGFAGMWVIYDEAHVTTIGVDPAYRGQGLGELLLVHLFGSAIGRGAKWLTLEVRVSNESALALYRKYGFAVHGTRPRYYSDNNEDAYVMWSPSLHDPAYLERFAELRNAAEARLGDRFTHDQDRPHDGPIAGSPHRATVADIPVDRGA
ncbi:MAG: Ribosomal-protein-S18p-alanine acetyltransferase [uncultured Thermomicrobiales bacterium]|uniref:Ribosomal-protein-S18p-alanine acetyltransferase n=1 Tax=uncultured Thermomicrobiales bacterium TaxID=1645740 RepID=A0A6J4UGY6_9BACT|nr:MAG: Ribosomal-protein-S18p-alanine acetyltransferase [uncultured Thermomicrobiales bacterium]